MVSPRILDFAALLAPIPGAQPSGKRLLHDPLYDAIRDARRADIAENWGEWQRELKTADWSAVIELACQALTTQSAVLETVRETLGLKDTDHYTTQNGDTK